MSRLLEVVNLRKRFQMHTQNDKLIPALEDVSFTVDEGEIVALTGKSGSGKSTLMKCIYRTYLSNDGQILYTGESGTVTDLVGASEHVILQIRKSEMTYCSQFLQVIPRVPAVDVVASALIARGYGSEEARELTKEYFARLSLPEELWDAYPATFSGGEQQRVNIARAIVPRPRFLLVDEPTASLDVKTKNAVIDMILDLKNAGTSVILISHDEHSLQRMADRSLVLEYGKLKEVVYA
jgi:alpha-D-ribose 1-methylphosphonate 5-triphosphate synthase subunit PhnL